MFHEIKIRTQHRNQLISVTDSVRNLVDQGSVTNGLCLIHVPHTTAGVTINEDADPDVATDILMTLDKLVGRDPRYRHAEGNSDSHAKASIVGCSVTISIRDGRLDLGRWQGIFFCEFDGPRDRSLRVTLFG